MLFKMYHGSLLACFKVSLPFLEAKIEHVWFSEAKRVYLNKYFYLGKHRVSYFENKRKYKLFFDWKKILILT